MHDHDDIDTIIIGEGRSQSNVASDSTYFLFAPLTTFFVVANAIPLFSIHDITQEKNQ